VAPAIALIPFAAVAAAAAVAVLDTSRAIAPAAILALPTILAGAAGGVVSIVRDAPDPTKTTSQAFVPPEMAGISSAMRVGLPILVSALAAATVLLVRRAEQLGTSPTGAAVRGAIGALLLTFVTSYWVRRRDQWRRKFRQFMSDGQSYTKQQRSTPA
jgi:hypothetical protein